MFSSTFCLLSLHDVSFAPADGIQSIHQKILTHLASTVTSQRILWDVQWGLASFDEWPRLNETHTQWPTVPDDASQEALIHDFLQETSTESLKWNTCASCAKKVTSHDCTLIQDIKLDLNLLAHPDRCSDLTQNTWLHPDTCPPHISAFIWRWPDALLHGGEVIESEDGMSQQLCLCVTCL